MKLSTALITGLMLALLSTAISAGELYRWVDDNGVVHYGDTIPAEYSSRQREQLNQQGIVVRTYDAQKTPEQLAAEARARAVEAQRMRQEQIQFQRDRVLLDTYLSVEEIEMLRDRRLALLVSQTRVTEQYLNTLHSRLGGLEDEATRYNYPYDKESDAPPLPDNLAQEMMNTLESVSQYEATLQSKREEQSNLISEFNRDIDRFRELKKRN